MNLYQNNVLRLDDINLNDMPRTNGLEDEVIEQIHTKEIINRYTGVKKIVVTELLNGYNFNQIARNRNLKPSQVYRIKQELMIEYEKLNDERFRRSFVSSNRDSLNMFFRYSREIVRQLKFGQFLDCFVYDYDAEAQAKGWKAIKFQDTLFDIWTTYDKTCTLAPREHLKTFSILGYLLYSLYTREFPLEINYYHLSGELAQEKFNKLRRIIDNSPLIAENLQLKEARSDKQDYLELKDGTVLKPLSYAQNSTGKHPHIILIDDPINKDVIYSDLKNEKAIIRFYTDIFPQISKAKENKKIHIIGTAQRKDDLYQSLPTDFKLSIFKAITDDATKQVLAPDLYSYDELQVIKRNMSAKFGEKYWLKEYQNEPFESMGLIIKPEHIKYFKPAELETIVEIKGDKRVTLMDKLEIFTGWDLSVGKDLERGDWTAGCTIGIDNTESKIKIYILDMFRARIDFPARLKIITENFNSFQPLNIGIENVAFQYDTIQTLKNSTLMPIIPIKAITNKIESFRTELAPYFENGQVYIKEGLEDFVTELLSLPVGEFDDQADALKIAIKTALNRKPEPKITFLG